MDVTGPEYVRPQEGNWGLDFAHGCGKKRKKFRQAQETRVNFEEVGNGRRREENFREGLVHTCLPTVWLARDCR
jgi:hypothetical protein